MPQHPGAKFKVDGSQLGGGKKPLLHTAAASWCGVSQKQKEAVDASLHAKNINVVMCDKESNKDHPVCKLGSKGYPATYNSLKAGSQPCHVGYDADVDAIVAKCTV